MLKAIAESDPVEEDGFIKQKGKPAKRTCGPPPSGVAISKGFASYRELEVLAHTTDDDPVGGPAEAEPLGTVQKWFHRCATSIADGDEIKRKRDVIDKSRDMLDHKNLPSKDDHMRAEVLNEDKASKLVE